MIPTVGYELVVKANREAQKVSQGFRALSPFPERDYFTLIDGADNNGFYNRIKAGEIRLKGVCCDFSGGIEDVGAPVISFITMWDAYSVWQAGVLYRLGG